MSKLSPNYLVTLDRIAAGRGVLVDENGDAWEVPASALPEGCKEGDLLDIRLRPRRKETKKLAKDIQELQQKLMQLKERQKGNR